MIDQVVDRAGEGVGQALAAGVEGTAGGFLSMALSPIGLAVMAAALAFALWKGRR